MHAIHLDDIQCDPPSQSSLSVWNFDNEISTAPVVTVHRTVRRHRTDLSWIPVTLFVLAGTCALCVLAESLVEAPKQKHSRLVVSEPTPRNKPASKPQVPPREVADPPVPVPGPTPVSDEPQPPNAPETQNPDAAAWVADALEACREGRLKDAQTMARRAMQKPRIKADGRAVWLLVEYLRQYEILSREAVEHMNGTVVIDLGPDHGVGAFVEREGDKVLFRCSGQSVWLTLDQLHAVGEVQYRITKHFLANGSKPANDLILAALHIAWQIDDAGSFDADGAGARSAARKCLEAAAAAGDQVVVNHATLLKSLLDG